MLCAAALLTIPLTKPPRRFTLRESGSILPHLSHLSHRRISMTTIQWRPQVNALTKPQSYRPQVVPRGTSGYDKMATDISTAHPVYNADLIRSVAPLIMDWIQQELISGLQVTLEDAFTFHPSMTGKMAGPDDPLPNANELLQVNVYAARAFVQAVRQKAKLERLPMSEKLPLVTSSEDTKLKLADVLNPNGLLRLTGSNLFFDEEDPDCGCIIAGSWSGETKQSTFGDISNTGILLSPDIPAQDESWQNEYSLSIITQYTEHGTPRTGIYRRKLRTPLIINGLAFETGPGILTGGGSADAPYARIQSGEAPASEVLRIQAVLDPHLDKLLLNLIDMKEGGSAGPELAITAIGTYTLQGFSGSGVTELVVCVDNYSDLFSLVRNSYSGRLTDVLDVKVA
jgi:hypothetical protein